MKNVSIVMVCVCLASCVKNVTVGLCSDITLIHRFFEAACQVNECIGSEVYISACVKNVSIVICVCLATHSKTLQLGLAQTVLLFSSFFVAMGLVSEFAGSESCIYFSASVKNVGYVMICVCLASCIKNFTAELC